MLMVRQSIYPLLALSTLVLPALASAQTLTCNFFASPSGGGKGLSAASPTTLTGAQALAEAAPNNTTSRVICLEDGSGGSYGTGGGTWTLNSSDSNETYVAAKQYGATLNFAKIISYLYPNPANISFYGIVFTGLDGSSGGTSALYLSAAHASGSGYTVRWNKFQNCTNTCVYLGGASYSTVDDNEITGISPGQFSNGNFSTGISAFANASHDDISYNYSHDNQGGSIFWSDKSAIDTNDKITCNLLVNNQRSSYDSGDIYFQENSCTSANVQISDNSVFGSGRNSTKGIYLDDDTCYVTVKRNVIAQNAVSGYVPEFGGFIHGGGHNTWQYNTIQLLPWSSYTDHFGLVSVGNFAFGYQGCASCSPTNGAGNVVQDNIFFMNSGWPNQSLWWTDSPEAAPTYATDDYWTSVPANWGTYTDASAFNQNPQFTNPSGNNFTVINNTVIANLGWPGQQCTPGQRSYGITLTNGPDPTPTPHPAQRGDSAFPAARVRDRVLGSYRALNSPLAVISCATSLYGSTTG